MIGSAKADGLLARRPSIPLTARLFLVDLGTQVLDSSPAKYFESAADRLARGAWTLAEKARGGSGWT
jgi:hypothetical protein